jgi:cleavage stimulation factor subunit 3
MTARKALRELRAMYDDLHEPALPSRPEWSSQDRSHLEKWKKYLAYEEANPLDIEEASILNARVQFAFKKAVGSLRFFSEIW